MSDQRNGGIVWTEQTWNPLRGCSRVSEGCRNCYAESMAARFCGAGMPYKNTINTETKRWNGTIKLVHERLTDPLRWSRPRMVFVNSMSDLFHDDVPDEFIDQVFAVMALAKQHIFQVLTKRPERMLAYCKTLGRHHEVDRVSLEAKKLNTETGFHYTMTNSGWALPNVWLGTTVENQDAADERIPLLLQTPAAVRWVSMEPLLGAVDLTGLNQEAQEGDDVLRGYHHHAEGGWLLQSKLDWVVVGGESGNNARPMHPDWARSLRDQCAAAGVPFMFKQWGEWEIASVANGNQDSDMVRNNAIWLDVDGKTSKPSSLDLDNAYAMVRVGKKAAGRLLDDRLHDGYPVK
jgi:protein gp37